MHVGPRRPARPPESRRGGGHRPCRNTTVSMYVTPCPWCFLCKLSDLLPATLPDLGVGLVSA
eukprot:13393512-Heterocapsa_arctica.AAC.1